MAGILDLFRSPKKEEKHSSESGPIEIHHPRAPPYRPNFGGLIPATIKFKGLYDLDGLYKFIANWLRQRRYEVHETMYKSKPPELEIRMYGERKHTGFVMWVLTIYYHSWGEYDVDVVINSKKKEDDKRQDETRSERQRSSALRRHVWQAQMDFQRN